MRRLIFCAAVVLLTACSSSQPPIAEVSLPALDGGKSQPVFACPAPKCLTAYVAPWCPHCRESTPTIISFRDFLKAQGVPLRVVVGQDQPDALAAYAKEFGPETFIDADGRVPANGVPHFYVTDKDGRLLKEVPGMPITDDLSQLAAYFELP